MGKKNPILYYPLKHYPLVLGWNLKGDSITFRNQLNDFYATYKHKKDKTLHIRGDVNLNKMNVLVGIDREGMIHIYKL